MIGAVFYKEKNMLLVTQKSPYIAQEEAMFELLVRQGEEKCSTTLPFDLRMFLVQCLLEHEKDVDIVDRLLAIDFLQSSDLSGSQRTLVLKRGGDTSLLFAGLFPERALRLNVSTLYFRSMGQMFYSNLAVHLIASPLSEIGYFYNTVTENFTLLEKVLLSARGKAENEWESFRRFRAKLN